ncbi:MAG: transcriptional regulator, TraR/DksA family [Bryobacterales bacterium]|nr:transcriptional regulator, TraR/DksA family [Bryobacterales bacterium]
MTKTELNAFRRILENSQTELGNDNRNREALVIETSPDDLDRIQHASERDYAMSNLERNSGRLREVEAALGRMEAGTFGICVGCDEHINLKRLTAVPWTSFCIVCQEAADRAEKMPSGEVDTAQLIAA